MSAYSGRFVIPSFPSESGLSVPVPLITSLPPDSGSVYLSPSLWLTDFYLSQLLANAYQAQLQAQQDAEANAAAQDYAHGGLPGIR